MKDSNVSLIMVVLSLIMIVSTVLMESIFLLILSMCILFSFVILCCLFENKEMEKKK